MRKQLLGVMAIAMLLIVGLIAPASAQHTNPDTINWDGQRGSENADQGECEFGAEWHFILAPGGAAITDVGPLSTNQGTAAPSQAGEGAYHFYVEGEGSVTSASVEVSYDHNPGGQGKPHLTISSAECLPDPDPDPDPTPPTPSATSSSTCEHFTVTLGVEGSSGNSFKVIDANGTVDDYNGDLHSGWINAGETDTLTFAPEDGTVKVYYWSSSKNTWINSYDGGERWKFDWSDPGNCDEPERPKRIKAKAPEFVPGDCDTDPSVTLPRSRKVTYEVNGDIAFGETVTVTATAKDGFKLKGKSEWEHTFGDEPTDCDSPPPPPPPAPEGEVGLVYECVEDAVSYEIVGEGDADFPVHVLVNGDELISTTIGEDGVFFQHISLEPGDIVTINDKELLPIEELDCTPPPPPATCPEGSDMNEGEEIPEGETEESFCNEEDDNGEEPTEEPTEEPEEADEEEVTEIVPVERTATETLPVTGGNAALLALLAAILMGGGVGTLAFARRRQ